ncbi:Divalent-cation tolerance protein CutA [Botrimarina colliarenosi]|uniref:Divalent-cation tolerance protein CutA n=1 Tax=Botrimarina colliarenosi TaxID=2528001 RepID=A0A5C6ARF8_9BACT|nr:divalent-cation tolerance protein CutA [Botrimarina colliarenosi]TWU00724.1 Divalent-cation tolerance protein CutA [Botrimarina colliarenosi]
MILVATTTPDRATADAIAAALVEQRLAACVQISGPITSVYRWEGAVETGQEWLCTAKTTAERWLEVERLVTELHPYETPELIATPITHASPVYAEWLREQVAESAGRSR